MDVKKETPSECPICGMKVPPTARACPNCGADERTGWDEESTRYDGIDLPDNDDEPGKRNPHLHPKGADSTGIPHFTRIVALVLLGLLIVLLLRRGL